MNDQLRLCPDCDSIGAYTTYNYAENRYRAPHEMMGHWKAKYTAQKTAAELEIPDHWDRVELLEAIKVLNEKLETAKQAYQGLDNDLENARKTIRSYEETIVKVTKASQESEKQAQVQALLAGTWKKLLPEYGDHKPDCSYVEASSCGRVLQESEQELCDCGWCQVRELTDSLILAVNGDKQKITEGCRIIEGPKG